MLAALLITLVFVNGAAVRFTMGAFALRIDSTAVLVGCGVGDFNGIARRDPSCHPGLENAHRRWVKSCLNSIMVAQDNLHFKGNFTMKPFLRYTLQSS